MDKIWSTFLCWARGYEYIDVDVIFSQDVQKWKRNAIAMLENIKLEKEGHSLKLKVNCVNAQDTIKNVWIGFSKVVFSSGQGKIDIVKSVQNAWLPNTEKEGMVIMVGDNAEYELVPCYPDSRIIYITIASFPDNTYRACWMTSGFVLGDYSRSDRNTFDSKDYNSERRKQSVDTEEELKNKKESADLPFHPTRVIPKKKHIKIRFSSVLSRKAFSDFMEKYLVGIEPIWVTGEDPVEEGSTCLILCFTLSRLLDDISATMNIIPKGCINMLIVIHNCRKGASPGPMLKYNPDKRLQDFTNVIYAEGECYSCPLNLEATEKIQAYIDKT